MTTKPRKKRARRKIRCHITIWGYPTTDDNDGPIDWAWSCNCGTGNHGFNESGARAAAADHLDEA